MFLSLSWKTASRQQYEIRVTGYPVGKRSTTVSLPDIAPSRIFFSKERGGQGGKLPTVVIEDFRWTEVSTTKFKRPVNHKKQAFIELRIQASEQLNGTIDQLRGTVEGLIPVYDASEQTWSAPTKTRNPVWHAADILRQYSDVPDSRIDLDRFAEVAAVCEPTQGEYSRPHDKIFDFDSDCFQVLSDTLSIAFAAPHLSDGIWTILLEEKKTAHAQVYSARNTSSNRYEKIITDIPHAIRVKYISEEANWGQDELVVYDRGYGLRPAITPADWVLSFEAGGNVIRPSFSASFDLRDYFDPLTWVKLNPSSSTDPKFAVNTQDDTVLIRSVSEDKLTLWGSPIQTSFTAGVGSTLETKEATKFETLEVYGCTYLPLAWQHGRRAFLFAPVRSDMMNFETDWEHLVSERGDMVLYSNFIFEGHQQAGRIDSFITKEDGSILGFSLDEEIQYEQPSTQDYGMWVRSSTSVDQYFTLSSPRPASSSTNVYFGMDGAESSTFESPSGVNASIGDLVVIGKAVEVAEEVNVIAISPLEGYRARVSVQPHGGSVTDKWLTEAIPGSTATQRPSFIVDENNDLRPPGTPQLIHAGIRTQGVRGQESFDVSLPNGPNTGRFDKDYEVYLQVKPNPRSAGESPTVAYNAQFRIRSISQYTQPRLTPLGELVQISSSWNTFASGSTDTEMSGYLEDFAFPYTSVPPDATLETIESDYYDRVDVRVQSVSSNGITSDWVQSSSTGLMPFDSRLKPPHAVKIKQVLVEDGPAVRADAIITWAQTPVGPDQTYSGTSGIVLGGGVSDAGLSYYKWRVVVQSEDQIIADQYVNTASLTITNVPYGVLTVSVQAVTQDGIGSFPGFVSDLVYVPATIDVVVPAPTRYSASRCSYNNWIYSTGSQ